MTETEFTDEILKWSQTFGWRRFHVRGNTKRLVQGDVGFPDLVLVRGQHMVVAELKVGKNKATPEQTAWLAAFNRLDSVQTYLWRPEMWSEILVVLSKDAR